MGITAFKAPYCSNNQVLWDTYSFNILSTVVSRADGGNVGWPESRALSPVAEPKAPSSAPGLVVPDSLICTLALALAWTVMKVKAESQKRLLL